MPSGGDEARGRIGEHPLDDEYFQAFPRAMLQKVFLSVTVSRLPSPPVELLRFIIQAAVLNNFVLDSFALNDQVLLACSIASIQGRQLVCKICRIFAGTWPPYAEI